MAHPRPHHPTSGTRHRADHRRLAHHQRSPRRPSMHHHALLTTVPAPIKTTPPPPPTSRHRQQRHPQHVNRSHTRHHPPRSAPPDHTETITPPVHPNSRDRSGLARCVRLRLALLRELPPGLLFGDRLLQLKERSTSSLDRSPKQSSRERRPALEGVLEFAPETNRRAFGREARDGE